METLLYLCTPKPGMKFILDLNLGTWRSPVVHPATAGGSLAQSQEV